MNKEELLVDLKNRDFIDWIGEPELLEEKPDGAKWYSVNVREVVGKAAVYRNIHFYVINEGTKNEKAYYKDREPVANIKQVETAE